MLSPILEKTLGTALGLATDKGHEFATLEHLLYALTEDTDTAPVLKACGANIADLRTQLARYIDTDLEYLINPKTEGQAKPTTALQRVLQRAVIHMQSSGRTEVNGAHVLIALFSEKESHAVYFLQEQHITRFDAINFIAHGVAKKPPETPEVFRSGIKSNKYDAKDKTSEAFESCCINLNDKARAGKIDPLIGRETEIDRTIQILCRRSKNNPLYVGDPGVGKTAIAAGLAARIVSGDVPDVLKTATIYSLDMASLVAGTVYRGEFEEKLKNILKTLQDIPESILFIDEIHTLIRAGAVEGGSMDAANILKPALADGSLRCMGATTYQEYRQYFEKDAALTRRFQKIDVPEPTIDQSILILHGLRERYEKHHKVRYTDGAIEAAVKLSAKYIGGRKLPDKAIDIMDEVGAAQLLLPPARRKTIIDVAEIEGVVAALARIPAKTLSGDDAAVLKNLEETLRAQVFDQDEAVKILAGAMKLSRAGLRDGEKPLGSYLFTGPTGVGKTEVARALAKAMGLELLRFDMSEYAEKHEVSRLIGSPPGYMGHEEGGQLTMKMEKHPR